MKKIGWLVAALVLGIAGLAERPRAQVRAEAVVRSETVNGIETLQIRPNVYVLMGGGANIVAHVGWMGVILVDAGSADASERVLAALQRVTDQKIRFIVNTTADADHVGGNAALARAGRTLLRYNAPNTGGFAGNDFQTNRGAAGIMAQENVLTRMSATVGDKPAFPGEGWPTEPFTGNRVKSLYLNNDGVQIFHQPNAHSDADSIVHFRKADVISSGPIVDLRTFPVIDIDRGGSIGGLITALNNLVEMTIPPSPLNWHEDRTFVVPAYGRVMDQADVVEYRDMVVVIRDRIADGVKKGLTLEQIRKTEPTKGFRGQYGPATGRWTNDMFVTAVYRSLTSKSS
ncbi:MAG: MBL fold metallo-hydrolase [Acidimicrobiia bacterium]|nr:MBL fold metallo-hydrolase [Acidimicrobiia bacterium]